MSGNDAKKSDIPSEQFAYLEMPQGLPRFAEEETFFDKLVRKNKENPFVPIGLIVTVGALTVGLGTLGTGNSRLSQNMMRLRVGAQGFTVLALLAGIGIKGSAD